MRPRARILTFGLLTLTALVVPGLPARAATTCAFDPRAAQVTITAGDDEDVVLARSGDALAVNGADCDTATVTTTDAVVIYGGMNTNVTLDLSGGSFAPGKADEPGADDEIELTVDFNTVAGQLVTVLGTTGSDTILAGEEDDEASLNLNGSEASGDADVTVLGAFQGILLDGGRRDDELSGMGGPGVALPWNDHEFAANGGPGEDVLVGSLRGGDLDGGARADTLSFEHPEFNGVRVDLASGSADPSVGDQYAIDGIENAVGSQGDDVIFGDDGPNVLEGGEGFDILTPGGGDDHVDGGPRSDTLDLGDAPAGLTIDLIEGWVTGDGSDTFADIEGATGGDHDDVFIAGPELTQGLDGRDGTDTLDLSNSQNPAIVNLFDGQAAAFDWNQNVYSFESIVGTPSGDVLRGSFAPNRIAGKGGADLIWGVGDPDTLMGGAGDDVILGGAHDDSIDGGAGRDAVDFDDSGQGVAVDLLEGTATGQGHDVLSSIESASGTDRHDHFVGTPGRDRFWGEDGFDTIDYRRAGSGVRVSLADEAATGDGADHLNSFERVLGTSFSDIIQGDTAWNVLVGRGGADRLLGLGGGDRLRGNLGSDGLDGGSGQDDCAGGPGEDEIVNCE